MWNDVAHTANGMQSEQYEVQLSLNETSALMNHQKGENKGWG